MPHRRTKKKTKKAFKKKETRLKARAPTCKSWVLTFLRQTFLEKEKSERLVFEFALELQ